MSPQLVRNIAARSLFSELVRRYPDLEHARLRAQLNEVVNEELRLIERDVLNEARRGRHFHGVLVGDVEDQLITAHKVLGAIRRRMNGEVI